MQFCGANVFVVAVAVVAFCQCGLTNATVWYSPQQVHIATGSWDEMTIVWNTFNKTNDSFVIYGEKKGRLDREAPGSSSMFVDGGSERRSQYIHTVILDGLFPDTFYYYMVGSKQFGFSDIFSFRTWPEGEAWSPSLAIYGDMGNANARSLPRLELEAAMGMYHAVIHAGDFAYNMETDNARVGDEFMRQIESLASSLPYMTCPGNHEQAYNFSNYKNRFRMPGDVGQRMFYSFKMGPVRFISLSTENIFFPQYGLTPILEQYQWLKNELEDANKPENRQKQPWVITFGHRPMYCSNADRDDCTKYESLTRTGLPVLHILSWEELFYQYGVDVAIWAHEHSYERMWPIYNRQVMNGSIEQPYVNPGAPVHITTGSAGCHEDHDPFNKTMPHWSAFRSEDYGYMRMTVVNASHLSLEQVSVDQGGSVIDKVMVIKSSHGPYDKPVHPSPIKPHAGSRKLVKEWLKIANSHNVQIPDY